MNTRKTSFPDYPDYVDNQTFLSYREKQIWQQVGQRVGHFMEEKFLEALYV